MMNVGMKDVVIPKLKSIPMFAELPRDDLDTLAEMVSLQTIPKGTVIIAKNQPGETMYLLVSGRVKVTLASSARAKELALSYLDAPAHFGEMSLVDAEPRSADVVAVTDVEVLALEAKDLSAAIRVQPRLALSLIATLSRRLRQTIARLEDLVFHGASHRVMRVILNVATAAYESLGAPVVTGLTHYEIATLSGTSRETTTRIISGLVKDGVIATRGRKMQVDIPALRARMESE